MKRRAAQSRHVRPAPGLQGQARPGASLIEVVVVMSVASVMLGVAITTIHLLLRAEREFTQSAWHAQSEARLSQLLRQDVHAGESVELTALERPPGQMLRVRFGPDRWAEYRIDGQRIVRRLSAAGQTVHRDAYYVPPQSRLEFQHDAEPRLVRLIVRHPAGPPMPAAASGASPEPAWHWWRVEAVVARDRRFQAEAQE